MTEPAGLFETLLGHQFQWLFRDSTYWTVIGLSGNLLFSSRFLIQWLYSEKHKRVIVPPVFWHISFWGSVISLVYAVHVDKLPIVLGCCFLPFVYARNLLLLKGNAAKPAEEPAEANAG